MFGDTISCSSQEYLESVGNVGVSAIAGATRLMTRVKQEGSPAQRDSRACVDSNFLSLTPGSLFKAHFSIIWKKVS